MTALPVMLTPKELARIRKEVFMDNRADVDFVIEALGETDYWHKALLSGDAVELSRKIDQAVLDYCERCGYFKNAEADLLVAIELNGGRKIA